jgi:hypothetical protein
MTKINLLLCALLLFFLSSTAQKEYFEKSIVVKKNADTLHGYVLRLRDSMLADSVSFSLSPKGAESISFSPNDLSSFTLLDENATYQPVTCRNIKKGTPFTEKRFALLFLKGYCSLYQLELKEDEMNIIFLFGNTHVFIAQKSDSFTVLRETEAMVGDLYQLEKDYLVQMGILFKDCPAVDSMTIAGTAFYKKDLIKIFTTYNLCKQSGSRPTTYKIKAPMTIKAGAFIGYNLYTVSGMRPVSGGSLGLFVGMLNPRVNERIAICMGVTFANYYATADSSNGSISYPVRANSFGVPFYLNYYFNKGRILPFLSFGITPIWLKANSTDGFYNNGVEKDWTLLGSFGAGVAISKFYAEALVEKPGIVTFAQGTFFSFRVGVSF